MAHVFPRRDVMLVCSVANATRNRSTAACVAQPEGPMLIFGPIQTIFPSDIQFLYHIDMYQSIHHIISTFYNFVPKLICNGCYFDEKYTQANLQFVFVTRGKRDQWKVITDLTFDLVEIKNVQLLRRIFFHFSVALKKCL